MGDLAQCERFFNRFRGMGNVKERLIAWKYKMTFDEIYDDIKRNVELLTFMAKTIRSSKAFKQTLASILACGNFINGGTKKGAKHGFELETLSKIGAYRTTDSTMSILGYIYKFLREFYPESLSWMDAMATLPAVIRVESDFLDSEIVQMEKDLDRVQGLLGDEKKDDGDDIDKFDEIMREWYAQTKAKASALQKLFTDTISDVQDLAAFYGEKVKPSQFKMEEFFGIFNEFRLTFIESRDKIEKDEAEKEKAKKKAAAAAKREEEMRALKLKKKAEKAEKARKREEKKKRKAARKKKVGFAAAAEDGDGDDGDDSERRAKRSGKGSKKGKTDKMLDEMGDATKYLAKLRKNRRNKSKGDVLGGHRKKSLFFKSRGAAATLPPEIASLRSELAQGSTHEDEEEM